MVAGYISKGLVLILELLAKDTTEQKRVWEFRQVLRQRQRELNVAWKCDSASLRSSRFFQATPLGKLFMTSSDIKLVWVVWRWTKKRVKILSSSVTSSTQMQNTPWIGQERMRNVHKIKSARAKSARYICKFVTFLSPFSLWLLNVATKTHTTGAYL